MLEHIAKAVEASKTVRGARDFHALRDPTEPKNLILYQSYDNAEAVHRWLSAPEHLEFVTNMAPFMEVFPPLVLYYSLDLKVSTYSLPTEGAVQ